MGRKIYTDEMIQFLGAEYKKHGLPVVTEKFNQHYGMNKTPKQLKTVLTRHGLTCGRTTGELNKGALKAYTPEQKAWVKQNYPLMKLAELTDVFNRKFGTNKTIKQIRSFTRNHKIRSGRTGRFEKGQASWNKGKRGVGVPNSGNFKKGHCPHNHQPVGNEVITTDGYVRVKIAEPKLWEFKHRLVWEKHKGPIPKDCVIFHLDGDGLNNDIANLQMITRSEMISLNHLSRTDGIKYKELPDELKPSVLALAKLKNATHKAMKG